MAGGGEIKQRLDAKPGNEGYTDLFQEMSNV